MIASMSESEHTQASDAAESGHPPVRLYLVDGSGYIFRAYHALPPLTRKSDGMPVGAVQGFCNMLWKLLVEMRTAPDGPTHLAVIFDASGKTFRSDLYPAYKAHRPPAPEDLVPQFALVREAVACLVDGMASAQDIDAAVRYGLGPRWTLMGSLLTLHLAGGPGGMAGILDHAGAAIEQWWTPRHQPNLSDPQVRDRLIQAAEQVSAGAATQAWTTWRDEQLVSVLKLQQQGRLDEPTHKAPS
jgi:hypothetical protein